MSWLTVRNIFDVGTGRQLRSELYPVGEVCQEILIAPSEEIVIDIHVGMICSASDLNRWQLCGWWAYRLSLESETQSSAVKVSLHKLTE